MLILNFFWMGKLLNPYWLNHWLHFSTYGVERLRVGKSSATNELV